MNRIELTPAFLLHRRPYKNNSLLLDFLSRDFGKICLIGKGIRKSQRSIQMFQCLRISFVGRGDLQTLSNWEIDDTPRHFVGETLILGLYANELIVRLLHQNDPHIAIFNEYQSLIKQINTLNQPSQYWLLRIFEHHILAALGYGLNCQTDIHGGDIEPNKYYEYKLQSGFSPHSEGKISGDLLNFLQKKDFLKIPNETQLIACKNLNRQRLLQLLGGKPLNSRSLFYKNPF